MKSFTELKFFIWQLMPIILVVTGAVGVVVYFVRHRRAKKGAPMSERIKMWTWFWRTLGIWAMVIGAWMMIESFILQQQDEDELAELDEETDGKDEKKASKKKKKKRKSKDDDEEEEDEDDRSKRRKERDADEDEDEEDSRKKKRKRKRDDDDEE